MTHSDEDPKATKEALVDSITALVRDSSRGYDQSNYQESTFLRDVIGAIETHDAALVASVQAQQYAATREALADSLTAFLRNRWPDGTEVTFQHRTGALGGEIADALLASTGPLLDAEEVWAEGHEAHRINSRSTLAAQVDNPYRAEKP